MRKHNVVSIAFLVVAVIGLLFLVTPAQAQRGRPGGAAARPGYYRAPAYRGYGYYRAPAYRGRYFYGSYFWPGFGYYGYGYYPSYIYPYPNYYYSLPSYYYTSPSYYYGYSPPSAYVPDYSSTLVTPTPAASSVSIDVRLPVADAEVWFEGDKTKQTGTLRSFVSPALKPGAPYTYHVKARWQVDGTPFEQSRTVVVQAGQAVTVDFTILERETLPKPAGK
jgi:uncharacterized protein (TIGR03000 family)